MVREGFWGRAQQAYRVPVHPLLPFSVTALAGLVAFIAALQASILTVGLLLWMVGVATLAETSAGLAAVVYTLLAMVALSAHRGTLSAHTLPSFLAGEATIAVAGLVYVARSRRVAVESRERAAALAKAQAEAARAEAAIHARDEFLRAANHDLRTPLTAMRGVAQLMERRLARGTAEPEWLRAQVDVIIQSTGRMERIVGDVADAAHAQGGGALTLRPETVYLREIVESVGATIGDVDRVQLDMPARRLPVWADRSRLERVLQNVLENALKYSTATVTVRLHVEETFVVLEVRDQGQGIPPDELPFIFTRYYRASNAGHDVAGTGIGLATARTVIEQHGGRIELASTLGLGTTVRILLPLAEASIAVGAGVDAAP